MDRKLFLLDRSMANSDVKSLLGNPEKEKPDRLDYVSGMCGGYGFDYENLVIRFDNSVKLLEVKIVQY